MGVMGGGVGWWWMGVVGVGRLAWRGINYFFDFFNLLFFFSYFEWGIFLFYFYQDNQNSGLYLN